VDSAIGVKDFIVEMTLYPSGYNLEWENEEQKEKFLYEGMYIPTNIVITRIQMYKEFGYITLPRFVTYYDLLFI
jgi:hypothetical protein